MFQYLIDLVVPLGEKDKVNYITLAKYNFEPSLQMSEEFWIRGFEVWGEKYDLKVKVVEQRKEVVPGKSTRNLSAGTVKETPAIFRVIAVVEAEDRDLLVKISRVIEENSEQWQRAFGGYEA